MPQPLEKPKTNAKGQRAADIDNLLDTKTSNVFSRLTSKNDSGGRSIYTSQMQSMTDNDTGEVKEWVNQATKESFDGYFDSLGRGDLRTGLKQYMLDSLDATDDGTTDQNDQQLFGYASVNDFVNSLDRDGLKAFRKELYDDYAKDMQVELLQASKDKVEELNNAELSTAAVVARDEYNLRNYNQKTDELKEEAASKKSGGKSKANSNELTDIYNTILSTPIEGDLSTDTVLSGPTPYIERIKPVLSKYNYYMDVDKDGNFLLGKAGMKDQKKKRKIDPSRIQNISLLMEEIAALNNEKWSTPQPIIVK